MNEIALLFPERCEKADDVFSANLATVRQMEALVSAMLLLGRCESGMEGMPEQWVRLSDLVDETWAKYSGKAIEKGLEAQVDLLKECRVRSKPEYLKAIVNNLMSNAVTYSAPKSVIRLTTKVTDGLVHFCISNQVEGLEKCDLEKMTEPFWQKDPSRSDCDHHGLGLAIVQVMCKCMEIDIVSELDESILTFDLVFKQNPVV